MPVLRKLIPHWKYQFCQERHKMFPAACLITTPIKGSNYTICFAVTLSESQTRQSIIYLLKAQSNESIAWHICLFNINRNDIFFLPFSQKSKSTKIL